jgi:HSP20 family molecular chaperone IbpA
MYTQDPWKEIEAMERQMERMMAAFMQGGRCPSCDGENACGHEKIINELPPYDICTGDSAVHVLVEVQGKTANDIEVIADREMLTIATSPTRGDSTGGMLYTEYWRLRRHETYLQQYVKNEHKE